MPEIVTATLTDVAAFPAASCATAAKLCEPLGAVVVSQLKEYGLLLNCAPRLAESRRNWTDLTPTLSVAFAVKETVPDTVVFGKGAVIDTTGGIVSVVLLV